MSSCASFRYDENSTTKLFADAQAKTSSYRYGPKTMLRDTSSASLREAEGPRTEQFGKHRRKSRKSVQYAKRAMINRVAGAAITSSLRMSNQDSDANDDGGDFTDTLTSMQVGDRRGSSTAPTSPVGIPDIEGATLKSSLRDNNGQSATYRRASFEECAKKRPASSGSATSTTKAETRKANKARAKELTRAARAKRRAASVAHKTKNGVSAATVPPKSKLRTMFDRKTKSLVKGAATGLGATGALLLGGAVILAIIGSIIGIASAGSEMKKTNLEGMSEIEAKVAVYLTSKGLDALHVAAIMGNIEAESGFDPSLFEYGSGEGFGLCQWSFGRKSQLRAWAASKGRQAGDIDLQLDFLWAELTGEGEANSYASIQYDHAGFLAIDELEGAVMYFGRGFERPNEAAANWQRRIASAQKYYTILSSGANLPNNEVVKHAAQKMGCPYVWGAAGPDAFDCSGLVVWSYGQAGITSVSRTTYTQIKQCVEIPEEMAQPGDLVFMNFSAPGVPEHVGIYTAAGQMIHAPTFGQNVCIGNYRTFANNNDAKIYRFIG